jgi:hypothetical protein
VFDSSHKVVGQEGALFCLQIFDYATWGKYLQLFFKLQDFLDGKGVER